MRRALALLAALLAGAAVPLLVALVWATGWGASPGVLWETVVGFRVASTGVLDDHTAAPARRLVLLTAAAVGAGIAPLHDDAESVMRAADAALYEAKHAGRNRLRLAA